MITAGIDEVGRGCLAGPVVVASVILPDTVEDQYTHLLQQVRDSKKLSEKKRVQLNEFIKFIAIDYAIVFIENNVIDDINIRNATLQGMQQAYKNLNVTPDHVYVDGDFYTPIESEKYSCIPQGDDKIVAISAASIIAKVARDTYCIDVMHKEFPHYGWDKNKAYGTNAHYAAIQQYGITSYHRRSFNLKV